MYQDLNFVIFFDDLKSMRQRSENKCGQGKCLL